jgi:sugar transferase (PEP-CTERM/EpsH1 system associated)
MLKKKGTRKRTIMHLTHRLTFGGAERVLVNYLNGEHKEFNHIVCSFFQADDFQNQIISKDIEVVNLSKQIGTDVKAIKRLLILCNKRKVDVIHSQGWGTYLEGFLCSKCNLNKVKFVYAFHGKTINDVKGIPLRRIIAQRFGAKLGDAIIAPSEDMRRDYAETIGLDQKIIQVVYNGVDTIEFQPNKRETKLRSELQIPAKDTVIGCVARFDPVKNLPSLIKDFSRIHSNYPETRLMIVGDGEQMHDLQLLAESYDLGNVIHFLGRRDDISNCMNAMDVYVQPSFYEGFSMTILEAMSCGLPIVAYDVGGTKEMVSGGVNGYLVPLSTRTLYGALVKILRRGDDRIKKGLASREIVQQNFSLTAMRSNYTNLFLNL